MDYEPGEYKVRDLSLAEQGLLRIEWAEDHMPVIKQLKEKFSQKAPFHQVRISATLHVTKETAVFVRVLKELGAEVALSGCNPLSTQDDVAAQLVREEIKVFAWRQNNDEYYWCLDEIARMHPDLTVDDGADLTVGVHKDPKFFPLEVLGGTENTTAGVKRLRNMAKNNDLRYPIIAVNNAETKWDFDNIYGTGQGTIDGILRGTSILIASKNFVVAGYGHCGRGVAMKAKGMGANVIVTEINPIQALKAAMDGYRVMPMKEAAKIGDIFITTTGNKDIITRNHYPKLKNGAILGNVGHFNVEIRIDQLEEYALSKKTLRHGTTEYQLPHGKHVYLLAEGRLFNIAIAEGHPSSVMDLSFANHILSLIHLKGQHTKMENIVYDVSRSQDELVAKIKLKAMGIKIDHLTKQQKIYANSWSDGT